MKLVKECIKVEKNMLFDFAVLTIFNKHNILTTRLASSKNGIRVNYQIIDI